MRSKTIDNKGRDIRSLGRAMRSNGAFSAISGFVLLVAGKPLASFMGLPSAPVLVGLGIVLLVYAAALYRVTNGQSVARHFGYIAVALDIAWVIGSAAILISGWPALNLAGRWTVALLAEAVATFAVWQLFALRSADG